MEPTLTKVAECLYRNAHGTYFALLKVRGRQIKRSLKTTDAALARRRLSELRTKARGLAGEERAMTFEQLAERWRAIKETELRPASYKRLQSILRGMVPFFKGMPVRSIGNPEIENWKIKRSAQVGARTFNYERDTLRQILEYARIGLRILLDNPAEDLPKRKVAKPALEIPSKGQFRALIAAMRAEPRAREGPDFIEFLAYSGLRLGEARSVRWRDIDFERDTLTVTGGENGTKNHEARTIPLFPPLRRFLDELMQRRECAIHANDRLFTLESAKKALYTACKKANLPHYGHHAMRHFFCSNAIEAGCDFKVIAEWLGHKDGGVLVAKTYGHLRNEHSAAMAKRLTFGLSAPE